MSNAVLVCAAHPDDEVLGCGATMARHALEGDAVHVLILSQGLFSRQSASDNPDASLETLRSAARRANDLLGVRSIQFLDFPDNRLDSIDRLDVARAIETSIAELKPNIVYTHFNGDLNVDHVRVHEAVSIACRPVPGQPVRETYFFEVQSSTHWRPNVAFTPSHFVDVSETLDRKLEALRAYEMEMRPSPHARSLEAVEHLAKWRGSLVGVPAAEAFVNGFTILDRKTNG